MEILEISFSDIILPSVGNFVQTATNGKFVDFLTLNNTGIVKLEPNSSVPELVSSPLLSKFDIINIRFEAITFLVNITELLANE